MRTVGRLMRRVWGFQNDKSGRPAPDCARRSVGAKVGASAEEGLSFRKQVDPALGPWA